MQQSKPEPKKFPVERDPAKLVPPFRAKIEDLLRRVRNRGFKPMLWETYRSPERAEALKADGVYSNGNMSMHCLGLAVDIVDEEKRWAASPDFWKAIESECVMLGLTWGGWFKKIDPDTRKLIPNPDKPHVQAIPVALQNKMRKLSPEERQRFLEKLWTA